MVFGEKNKTKMGTFSDFVTIFSVMLWQNLIISLPTLNCVGMQQEPHIEFI